MIRQILRLELLKCHFLPFLIYRGLKTHKSFAPKALQGVQTPEIHQTRSAFDYVCPWDRKEKIVFGSLFDPLTQPFPLGPRPRKGQDGGERRQGAKVAFEPF